MRPDEFCRCATETVDKNWKFCPECSKTIARSANTLDLATADATFELSGSSPRPGAGFTTFWVGPANLTLAEWEMSARTRMIGEFCAAKLTKLGYPGREIQYCAFPALPFDRPIGDVFEWRKWAASPGNTHSYLSLAPGPVFGLRVRFNIGTQTRDAVLFFSREEVEEKFECIKEVHLPKFPTIVGAPNPAIYDLIFLLHMLLNRNGFREYFYESEAEQSD